MKSKNVAVNRTFFLLVLAFFLVLFSYTTYLFITGGISFGALDGWDGVTIAEEFTSGNGTKENPYVISNAEEFIYFQTLIEGDNYEAYQDKYYVLGDTIDFNEHAILPIGALVEKEDESFEERIFKGVLDGKGYSLKNFRITSAKALGETKYYSLFTKVEEASIYRMNLEDYRVSAVEEKGAVLSGFAGEMKKTTLENISFVRMELDTTKSEESSIGILTTKSDEESKFKNISIHGKVEGEGEVHYFEKGESSFVVSNLIYEGEIKDDLSEFYFVKDNKIYLKDEEVDSEEFVKTLKDGLEEEYEWKYENGIFTFYTHALDEKEEEKEATPDTQPFSFSILKAADIVLHDSGFSGRAVYINDLESDYNYYMGRNYTEITDNTGTIPSGENRGLYTNSNLATVYIRYSSTDINDSAARGTVSVSENYSDYYYYKRYPVVNGYVEFDLIDNPWANRPNGRAFNGWVTDFYGAVVSIDVDTYTRHVKIPVNSTANPISITFNASWTLATTATTTGGLGNLKSAGMAEVPKGSTEDLRNYYVYGRVNNGSNYPNSNDMYDMNGNAIAANTRCNGNNCQYVVRVTENTYDPNAAYYTVTSNYWGGRDVNRYYPALKAFSYYSGGVSAGYFRRVTDGTDNIYSQSGEKISFCGGDCYQLMQFSDGAINNNETYYYLVTRDTNIFAPTTTDAIYTSDISTSRPMTITGINNGEDNSSSRYIYINQDWTLNNDLRIEFITMYADVTSTSISTIQNGTEIYGNYHNFKIGRGLKYYTESTWWGTYNYITASSFIGGSNNATSSLEKYTTIIESGRYQNGSAVGHNSTQTHYVNANVILGNDFDRIAGNNDDLIVYYCYSGTWSSDLYSRGSTGNTYQTPAIYTVVKSGHFGENEADYAAGIYAGGRNNGAHYAIREVVVEGGNVFNLIGGPMSDSGRAGKNDIVINVKGGEVNMVFGGAGASNTIGNRILNITGGLVHYSVLGGSNAYSTGSSDPYGKIDGDTLVYVGGNVTIGDQDDSLYTISSGNVFGAGNGRQGELDVGSVNNSNVIIGPGASISGNVYGGGNFGAVGGSTSGNTTYSGGGTVVDDVYEDGTANNNIRYYGVNAENYIRFNNDTYRIVGLFNNVQTPNGTKNLVRIVRNSSMGNQGWVSTYTTVGSERYMYNYFVSTNNNYSAMYTYLNTTFYNGLNSTYRNYIQTATWGLGAISSYNNTAATFYNAERGNTQGCDNASTSASFNVGLLYASDYGYASNGSGCLATNLHNYNNGCYSSNWINSMMSGYNAWTLTPSNTSARVNSGGRRYVGYRVFNITGNRVNYQTANNNANPRTSATYPSFYLKDNVTISGGSGTSDDPYIIGTSNTTLVDVVYKRLHPDPIVEPDPEEEEFEDDGNYQAASDYQGTAHVQIIGGTIDGSVFGAGNNNGAGNLNGKKMALVQTIVDVNGGTVKGSVYGGSNEMGICYGDVLVRVTNGTIQQSVYGGGKGGYVSSSDPGTYVYRDVDVIIGGDSTTSLSIAQNVYGGSAFGSVNGLNQDTTKNDSHVRVKINAGTITGDVFGGGQGDGSHTPYEFGNVYVHVNGGNITRVFGGNDSSGEPSHHDIVYLNGGTIGNAFGGGNNTGQDLTDIRLQGSTITGNLYGGSNQSGTVKESRVAVTNGSVVDVYGGNNLDGRTLTSNVGIAGGNISGDIYGGGREAETNSTSVIIYNGSYNDVYGGGNNAGVAGAANVSVINGRINHVYGGSNHSGDVGDTYINVVNSYEEIHIVRDIDADLQLVNNGAHWDDGTVRRVSIYPVIKNYTDQDYTEWTATIRIPNSTFFREYLNSPLTVDGDTYTFSHINKYDANIPFVIPANGEKEIPGYFEVFVPIDQSYEIEFTLEAQNRVGDTTSYTGTYLDGIRLPDAINKGINYIFGGNNLGGSTNSSTINVNGGDVGEIYGGGNQVGITTSTLNLNGGDIVSVFGGSNQSGDVTTSNVNIGPTGLGTAAIQNVYGGNNAGGVTSQTNVTMTSGEAETIYGGGNEAVVTNTNVVVNGGETRDVYGGGNAASVQNNTIVDVNGGTILHNLYGGGNEGTVQHNTNVTITDATVLGNAFAGGNGATAIVHGNSTITIDGTTVIGSESTVAPDAGCVFGSGNAAATGLNGGNSEATVNIVGGTIYGNVYGGPKMSVVYGTTETNIGTSAVGINGLKEDDINIYGTVFGGGESNASGSETYDYTFISVTQGINVNIDGTGYIANDHDFILHGSIFGSGNASSSAGDSNINIKNLGSMDKPNQAISIQRATNLVIDSSVLELFGTTDRTNEYSDLIYSLNLIDKMIIKNNTTLLLQHNANKLQEFYSGVDVNGTLTKAAVDIDDNTKTVTRNVDNRLYMKSKENLNVALDKDGKVYGKVSGMTFFGMYIPQEDGTPRLGLYDPQYDYGDAGNGGLSIVGGSYVVGLHSNNHDITKDGFYTNSLDEDTFSEIITAYIDPTELGETGYRWTVGFEAIEYEVFLKISKYASLGTENLSLEDFSRGDSIYDVLSVDTSEFDPNTQILDPDSIPRVADTDEEANEAIGLAMKAETQEWINFGTTKILSANGGTFSGDTNYVTDSRNVPPSLMFYTYHAKNYNYVGDLGKVVIMLQVAVPRNAIEYDIKFVTITVYIEAKSFDDEPSYDASITYSKKYEMPAATSVYITNQSQFTAYFALNETYENFAAVYGVGNVNYHVLTFSDPLPVGTMITMLDMGANDNRPDYYYFKINQATYDASVIQKQQEGEVSYRLTNFIRMDSTSPGNVYNDAVANLAYFDPNTNMVDEEFIFIIDMKESTQTGTHLNQHVGFELRGADDWPLVNVLSIRNDLMNFHTYDSTNIVLSQIITETDDYLYYNVADDFHYATRILYNETENRQSVIDTNYEYSNMGLNVVLFNRSGELVSSSLLVGTNISIGNQEYYADGGGVFRIKLANKVSTIEREAKIVPGSALPAGEYTIRYTLFASEDGLHNSTYNNSVSNEKTVTVVSADNFITAECDDEAKLVYGETGLNHAGEGTNTYLIKYHSQLNHPNYRVEVYKRTTSDVNSITYTSIPFSRLFTNELQTVSGNEVRLPITEEDEQSFDFTLASNLQSGTYRVVFKLYDNNQIIDEDIKYVIVQKKID